MRNLPQVKVGDQVVVSYQEALLAEVVKPGTGSAGASSVAARADPGERPAAGVVDEVRMPVKIYAVDPYQNVVEVTGPRGYNRRIKVNDPKAREFIRGLKPGDEVQVTFREAFAVSVRSRRSSAGSSRAVRRPPARDHGHHESRPGKRARPENLDVPVSTLLPCGWLWCSWGCSSSSAS